MIKGNLPQSHQRGRNERVRRKLYSGRSCRSWRRRILSYHPCQDSALSSFSIPTSQRSHTVKRAPLLRKSVHNIEAVVLAFRFRARTERSRKAVRADAINATLAVVRAIGDTHGLGEAELLSGNISILEFRCVEREKKQRGTRDAS